MIANLEAVALNVGGDVGGDVGAFTLDASPNNSLGYQVHMMWQQFEVY